MSSKIEINDYVTVHFEHVERFEGYVESIPSAPGDCWVISASDGIHYVQAFAQIVKAV